MAFDRKEWQRRYWKENKERLQVQRKKNKTPDERRQYQRQWTQQNPDRVQQHRLNAQPLNPERCRKDYYANHEQRLADRRAYRAANPAKVRDAFLRWRYGVSLVFYELLFFTQKGCCAICQQPETAKNSAGVVKRLAVDHCHRTGRVRGLLCTRCNHLLGCVDDDPDVLRRAIAYLA